MLVSLLSHTLPIAAVKQQTTNAFTNGHKKFEHVAITGLAPSSSHHEFGTFIHAIAIRRARPESYSTLRVFVVVNGRAVDPSSLFRLRNFRFYLYSDTKIFLYGMGKWVGSLQLPFSCTLSLSSLLSFCAISSSFTHTQVQLVFCTNNADTTCWC